MNPTKGNSRESLQEAIDAEIKSLEESIQLLKLRRNALQPISSFPPEIFAAIFSFLCPSSVPSLGSLRENLARNRVRLRITHVCHQWREIALNQAQLWSHVNFNIVRSAGATKILARAQLAPLYMEIGNDGRHRFGRFLREVKAHLPNIRHLSIGADINLFYEGLKSALVSPAPSLEYLSLFCQEHKNEDLGMARQQSVPGIQFLDTLFGGSTPSRLSCLKLYNCITNWNSLLFKGIKFLSIETPLDRPTLAVWLDALGEMPQLEMLTLDRASPVATHFPFDVERTVTLPSLTHLDILASLPDCALALAHLVLPSLTSLRLTELFHHPTNTGRVQEFLPYVAQHFQGPQDIRPLQSVLIRKGCCAYSLNLLAWSVPDIDTLVHDPPTVLGTLLPTRVELCLLGKGDDHLEIFEMMMAALPLDSLLTFVAPYNCLPEVPMEPFWLRVLPNWPLLRRVRLAPILLCGFIKALEDGDSISPLLPSLTTLSLAPGSSDADWTLCLLDALMIRVEQGVPLETLDLRMCTSVDFNPIAVQLLSEIVVDVLHPGTEDENEMFYAVWNCLRWYPHSDREYTRMMLG